MGFATHDEGCLYISIRRQIGNSHTHKLVVERAPAPTMPVVRRRGGLLRIAAFLAIGLVVRLLFFSSSTPSRSTQSHQIKEHNFIERATRADKSLNVQKHPFLQARFGRDERDDIFNGLIYDGMMDYWTRLQLP